jgi:uncharacterized spore protein YtfJ
MTQTPPPAASADAARSDTARPDTARRPGLPVRVARDLLTVRRVFGEPITTDGVTLVPVARVIGGAGYGDGDGEWKKLGRDEEGTGSGSGGGFGVVVSPVGVYCVRGSDVTWQPATDMGRVILGGQVVGAIALLVLARIIRRRRR